jgi:hypothetical protein
MAAWEVVLAVSLVVASQVAGKHNKKQKSPLYEMDARTI